MIPFAFCSVPVRCVKKPAPLSTREPLPHELSALILQNKRLLYDLLFRTSAVTLLEVARDPKHLGADIGLLSVLHSWGQNLQQNPHS